MVTDGKNERNDACLNKKPFDHLLNGTKCVCRWFSVLYDWSVVTRHCNTFIHTPEENEKKTQFFSCPILFLDTFFLLFLLFGAQFAHVKLVWLGFFPPLSNASLVPCADTRLHNPYILIFINLGGAIRIHILQMRKRRKALHESMENTLGTLLRMLQKNRHHIEMCIRTAAIKQNKKGEPKQKSNINASRPADLCVKTNGICVIDNNMLVTLTPWTTEVMCERPLFRLSGSSIKLQHHIAQSSVGGAKFLSCPADVVQSHVEHGLFDRRQSPITGRRKNSLALSSITVVRTFALHVVIHCVCLLSTSRQLHVTHNDCEPELRSLSSSIVRTQ